MKLTSSGKRTDTEIAEAVLNSLKWNYSVKDDKIKVTVEDGWVTLEGEVEWAFQRNAIRLMIEDLIGVVGISNNIKIMPTLSANEVKQKITSAFQRSATVNSEKISIVVDGSKVILTGKVRSYVEKIDAENAAWLAPGVNRVENKLSIEKEVYAY